MLCQQPVPINRRRRSARRRWPLAVRRLPESSSTTPGALDLLRYGRNFRRASPPPRPPLVNSAEPSSAEALRKPDVSFSAGMLLSSTASEEPINAHTSSSASPHTVQHDDTDTLIPSQRCLRSSPGSSILVRRPPGWYFVFYIRMDPGGCFHMYPDVGNGPYRSLPEVDDAINQHLHNLRIPEMGEELDRLPLIERMIRQDMYWPDGKRKHFNLAGGYEKDKRCLIQALVEKYNDDHNLLGDFAYELKEFLQIGEMYEDQRYYYHINFTTKTKGAHKSGCAMDNLFFAELSHMQGKDEWVVSCCCVIKPTANGHCYGCRNDGKSGLKHPNNSDAYSGGHLDGCLPFGLNDSRSKYDGLNPEDEEAMLRSMYKDNVFVQLICTIQYRVVKEHADDAFYELQNPQQQIQAYVFDVVRAIVPRMNLDDLFEQKNDVAKAVLEELEKVMGDYGYSIEHILMVDIIPDAAVRRAMNEINAAQRLQLASVYKGEAEKILLVKKAEAEAEAKHLSGVGIARQRQAITDGLRENILNFSHSVSGTSAKEVMDLIMVTQYFDTIKELGDGSKNTTVFIPHGPGHVKDISEQIRNGMMEASCSNV